VKASIWLVLVAVVAVGLGFPARAGAQDAPPSEEAAVRAAVEAYFDALRKRDIETLKKLIPADTMFYSITRDGKLDAMTQERWHGLIRPTEQSPGPYEMTGSILSVDVTGSTAAVKSVIEMPRVIFQEYIALARIEGQWRIVNKVFTLKGKPRV
jgi:ketosteroid isomerase-like protein